MSVHRIFVLKLKHFRRMFECLPWVLAWYAHYVHRSLSGVNRLDYGRYGGDGRRRRIIKYVAVGAREFQTRLNDGKINAVLSELSVNCMCPFLGNGPTGQGTFATTQFRTLSGLLGSPLGLLRKRGGDIRRSLS
jgi:hypothetical protein